MPMFIVIWCILTAYVQASLPDKGENDQDQNKRVSRPTIHSPSMEISIGENVTLKCSSRTGSPPIIYTLYRGTSRVLPPVSTNKEGEEGEFHFTINSLSELGEYKCKAENKVHEGKYSRGFSFTKTESLSHLEIYSPSTEVSRGENVTLFCLLKTSSLPIEYSLYKGKDRLQHPTSKNKNEEAAEFHFPINFISELGEYKCKAKNKFGQQIYSVGFNFTMKGENNNLVAFIVPPLLLLLLATVVAVPFLILPWCKASATLTLTTRPLWKLWESSPKSCKNQLDALVIKTISPTDFQQTSGKLMKNVSSTGFLPASYPSSENDTTYTEIAHEKDQEEYVNMEFCIKKEISRKVSFKDATTVAYSEVVFRR